MARYFSPETDPKLFRCPCDRPACDAPEPTPALLELLAAIREALGHAVIVASGPRCEYWNTQVGGEIPSTHLFGEGADLECLSSADRELIDTVRRGGGHAHGYRRFGVGHTFVHVDVTQRPEFPQGVLWHYYGIARRRAGARLESVRRIQ